jgi:hypothetical protein
MSVKCLAASFNGKPKAAAFHGNGYAFGSPLNDIFQTFYVNNHPETWRCPAKYREQGNCRS